MRFGSSGSTVELTIEAYQFPESEPQNEQDWDANWLVIAGQISGWVPWRFRDPCLTTWEAREFAAWLDDVAHSERQPVPAHEGELSFTEPNLRVELRSRTVDDATLAFFFSHESAPPGTTDDVRLGDGYEVEVTMSTAEIAEASKGWMKHCEQFPER
ncbi:MAG: hypothetical protein J0I18_15820 [Actinobacteria bacterium]|nr:hypothetical protein [Actinomycetota bacterium]